MTTPEAVIVGSGPNGLAAAITLLRAGLSVEVQEGADTPGGGCRSDATTLPGVLHDSCAAVHPLAAASPFFRDFDLDRHGVKLCIPSVAFAHPLDGGRAASVSASVNATAASLGNDGATYRRLIGPLVESADQIVPELLAPLRGVPRHPFATARFARSGVQSAVRVADRFRGDEAAALLAGAAAHSMLPLDAPLSAGYGLLLATLAHTVGWPVVRGGSGRLVDALCAEIESLGGSIRTGHWVRSLDELPSSAAVLLEVSTRQLLELAGNRLGVRRRRVLRAYAYGLGVCKVDWALSAPVPWTAAACRSAGTLHLGGTIEEIRAGESETIAGRHPERPFVIAAQPTVLDPTRAPEGIHTLWAYCHVPPGSNVDMTERIENQIERFAPGFRDLVLARHTTTADEIERRTPNFVGGDINGGLPTLRQTLFRPTVSWNPYRTGIDKVYLCSASTPPGGGIHGMCGVGAANALLADLKRR